MDGHPSFIGNYKKALDISNQIIKESQDKKETYGVNIVGESLMITSFKHMPTEKLEQIRFIINKIIKEKKEQNYINKANKKNDKSECMLS